MTGPGGKHRAPGRPLGPDGEPAVPDDQGGRAGRPAPDDPTMERLVPAPVERHVETEPVPPPPTRVTRAVEPRGQRPTEPPTEPPTERPTEPPARPPTATQPPRPPVVDREPTRAIPIVRRQERLAQYYRADVPDEIDPGESTTSIPVIRPSEDDDGGQRTVLANSAVMAAGTVVSRLSGFVRSALLAAALGASLHADIFSIANTVPNMLYILLAGGVFNAVLVPQLVRAMRQDPDQGEAYTNRVVTLAALFLAAVTVALVAFAPQVMSLYLDSGFDGPDRAAHLDSVITFARYCLPQVFFYGMFVLVGQILNARGRFGPMMWAPIANNVISVATLVVYLVVFGPARGAETTGPYSNGQELLLGVGSTVGIAAQLVILVPYLKRAGFTFRPRFDFRGSGLGHTFRLGTWTVLFVVVNQVAYTVVVRLASAGTVDGGDGTGYSIYSSTFLIVMVPHSIITVSLATAILPRLSEQAASGELHRLGGTLSSSLRTTLAVVVPFAALLPLVAEDVAQVIWGHGAAADQFDRYAPSLALFGPGLVMFTVHYLMLRGFYALEQTRAVFFIQCAVSAVNIVAAVVLVRAADAVHTSPALVLAYLVSYAVGAAISYAVLARRVGGLDSARLVRFLVRLLIAVALATAAAAVVALLLGRVLEDPHWVVAGLRGGVVAGVEIAAFLVVARILRLGEVTEVIDTVTRRLSRAQRG
ncbi:murein biosynthesis integral membrane protein MurJ [Nocardioides dongxiaopingii]|uniref:murein biosynthesis integral membrane protein MurJ n=1 Tax=Nocardioides sp. S-1144 TaxID=2582905 RepID=UPI0021CB4634|nr:murein biosynthesis integral membrane protein MurJ [Nocardioides sp. S-1144]